MVVYLIGGAPRTGKTILAEQVARRLGIGWISTDVVLDLFRQRGVAGAKDAWDASPQAIREAADWFFPDLERLIFGMQSLADGYLVEGVDFLPAHTRQLSDEYELKAVFLGRSKMSLADFDAFPGRSPGYSKLPHQLRERNAADVPRWSEYIRLEAHRHGLPYIDTSANFPGPLREAEATLAPRT